MTIPSQIYGRGSGMKRSVAMVGAGLITVVLACLPVGAAVLDEDTSGPATPRTGTGTTLMVGATPGLSAGPSNLALAAIAGAFLASGAGTAAAAHRRRWRGVADGPGPGAEEPSGTGTWKVTIDLRDSVVAREGVVVDVREVERKVSDLGGSTPEV